MSDITGPPAPKPISPVSHGTDRAAKTSRDPQQTPKQTTDDSGENKSKSENRDSVQVRDPAVSIAASAAHLRIGEELKEHVKEIDAEGRPIIVTETATFALRPDAGLKAGDDVVLQVTETGKTVAADLLRKNSHVVDPPIRLSLIVIAIHVSPAVNTEHQTVPREELEVSYRPSRPTAVSTSATALQRGVASGNETEELAKLLSRGNTGQPVVAKTTERADNPDPLIKSNSSDLATLIAAQQTAASTIGTPATTQAPPPPHVQPPPPKSADGILQQPKTTLTPNVATAHIIPSSPLTDPSAVTAANTGTPPQTASTIPPLQQSGLGPVINAVSLAGAPTVIQLMDATISQVAPAEVAEVISVQPLPASVARSLPMNAQALGSGALAQMETSRGTFVLEASKAQTLQGELVKVGQANEPPTAQQTTTASSEATSYNARLTSPNAKEGRQVQLQLIQPSQVAAVTADSSQSHIITKVDKVHTTRAFLSSDGPKNDLRIETQFGTLTLTVGSGVRPAVGDTVAILPNAQPGAAPVTVPAGTDIAVPMPFRTDSWPTFEQAYALVQNGAPTAASALAARSAQGGPKLLNSMMFLFAALKGGSPSSWLGRSTEQALEPRNSGLLNLLKDELGRLFAAGAETATEWRALMLPFDAKSPDMPVLAALFGQTPAVDPDGENEAGQQNNQDKEDQRFIIEVHFSVLGALQLDGLVKNNRFDLTLWSHQRLPETLQQDTSALFGSALEANGFTGALRFKQSDTFPVDVAAVLNSQRAA